MDVCSKLCSNQIMASQGHEEPSLAVNVAIGHSVAQSLEASGKTTRTGSSQKPRSVMVSPLLTSLRDPRSSQPATLDPAAVNTALQALVKAQQSNPIPLQPKQQGSRPPGVLISSMPPSSKQASKQMTLNVKVINPNRKSESQTYVL